MARVSVFMSGASGKRGNVVFVTRKGRTYIRSKALSVKNPNTEGQQKHRTKFGDAMEYLRQIKQLIKITWKTTVDAQTEFNAAMSYMMKYSFIEVNGTFEIDRSKVKHTSGRMRGVSDLKAELMVGRKLVFTWRDNTGLGDAEGDNELGYIIFLTEQNIVYGGFTNAERKDERYEHEMENAWSGEKIAVYGFFIRKDRKDVSWDEFLGEFGTEKQNTKTI